MRSQRYTREVLQTIHDVLLPYFGKLMASTAAAAHCRQLGIDGPWMDREQIDLLLERLGLGLVIFLGRERTDTVIGDMRQAILTLQEAA